MIPIKHSADHTQIDYPNPIPLYMLWPIKNLSHHQTNGNGAPESLPRWISLVPLSFRQPFSRKQGTSTRAVRYRTRALLYSSDLLSHQPQEPDMLGRTTWDSLGVHQPRTAPLLQAASHPATLVLSCSQASFLGLKHSDLALPSLQLLWSLILSLHPEKLSPPITLHTSPCHDQPTPRMLSGGAAALTTERH